MATRTLDWRRGPLSISLPDEQTRVLTKPDLPMLGTPVELVERALADPIGCPRLEQMARPGDRVALLVTDMQDTVFGQQGVGLYLLNRLNAAGVPDERITLVHAAGMHGHPGARAKIGEAILQRVRYLEHDPMDERAVTYVGMTRAGTPVWVNTVVAEADLVVGVGACSPSLYGYQGGGGIILPGVAGNDTVRRNHTKIMTNRTSSCWGPGNPMREDVMDAADFVRLRLKIDFTANTVFAGYFREEWPVAVRYLQQHAMTPVAPADIYLFAPANSGELMSMYMQIELAEEAAKRDGVIIACISAARHQPLSNRPLAETLQEFVECTAQWTRLSDDGRAAHEHWRRRDMVCKEELLARSLDEITRLVTRMEGEPRSTTHVWSHKRCILNRRTVLVTEGVTPEEGERFGFRLVTDSFDEALRYARAHAGPSPRIIANLPPTNAVPWVERRDEADAGMLREAAHSP